jgi:hypothetical protein
MQNNAENRAKGLFIKKKDLPLQPEEKQQNKNKIDR